MTRSNKLGILLFFGLLFIFSCKKNTEEISDLDKLRNNTNQKTYPVTKMDSAQAIQFITKQKIQELLDLSTLYSNGKKDTEIDSIIYAQMNGYFANPDSAKLRPLLKLLDSFKVKSAKVGNLQIKKKVVGQDTVDYADFNLELFDHENKSVANFKKSAQYSLKLAPIKFKKEFKFYFENFVGTPPLKDSTAAGVTKKSTATSPK